MRFPGPHTSSAMLSKTGGGGIFLRKVEPAGVALPTSEKLVVRVSAEELDRVLEALRR